MKSFAPFPIYACLILALAHPLFGQPAGSKSGSTSSAAKARKAPLPIEPPIQVPASETLDFQGEEFADAIRILARRAKLNVVVSDQLKDRGTVTMRLEDKSPREAIEILVESKDCVITEAKGMLIIQPKTPPPLKEPVAPAKEASWEESITEMLVPAATKLLDAYLDYQTREETARKIARAKKILYDAFLAEGFSKEEAFRLTLMSNGLSLPNMDNTK